MSKSHHLLQGTIVSPSSSPSKQYQYELSSTVGEMRVLSNLVLALATITPALAINQKKSAIMYFKDTNMPDFVVDKAKETIIKAGCKITHEYSTTIR